MKPTLLDQLLAIAELFERDMRRAFHGTALTETRVHALWLLKHLGPATQQALAKELGTTARSVSALVDGLERAGYVRRALHPEDRRALLVTLTEEADAVMARMQVDHARLAAELTAAVDPEDLAAFERGIESVLARLSRLVDEESVHYGIEPPASGRSEDDE